MGQKNNTYYFVSVFWTRTAKDISPRPVRTARPPITTRTASVLGRPLDLEERAGVVLHHALPGARRVFVEVAVVRVVVLGLVARRVTFVADVVSRVAVVSGAVYRSNKDGG